MMMRPLANLFLVLGMSGGSGFLFGGAPTGSASAGRPATAGFADLVEKTLPGVVRVMTSSSGVATAGEPANISFGAQKNTPSARKVSGEGSGFVWSNDGHIVTNFHVVEGASRIRVQFHDGRESEARLIAGDAAIDLAVLQVPVSAAAKPLQPLPMGDSEKLRIGDLVLAIGNPFGVGTTVTQGIVSAMSPSKLGIAGDEDYIQTDAAVNPGNSGGPLLNTEGEVIGVNTAILSTSGGSNGIGFALPANVAKTMVRELIETGRVDRGYLGIAVQPMTPDLADALGDDAMAGSAVIAEVRPESPAAKAGLQKGDVITGMNGRVVRDFNRLRLFIAEARPGVASQLVVLRDGNEKNFWIVLGKRPENLPLASAAGGETLNPALPGAAISELPGGGGLLIVAVDPSGLSAQAGLRPGDVIVTANRQPIAGATTFERQMASASGAAILLEVNRQGSTYLLGFKKSN
jgi:Do/DeqQ family serine protease